MDTPSRLWRRWRTRRPPHVPDTAPAGPTPAPAADPAQPVVAPTLQHLPEHRREAMLWHRALTHTYEDAEELLNLPHHRQQPCTHKPMTRPGNWTAARAVRGDDGLFHLRLGPQAACGVLHPGAQGDAVVHLEREFLRPGEDPHRYYPDPHHDPFSRPGTHTWTAEGAQTRDRRWTTALLDGTAQDPTTVRRSERCPVRLDFGHWPTPIDPATPKGRLRRLLVETLGPACGGCHDAWGTYIDHDHFTGLIRGLLCRICNTHIDICPHLAGCPYADYLGNPPAAGLSLLYPDRAQDRRRDRRKIALTGLDPYNT